LHIFSVPIHIIGLVTIVSTPSVTPVDQQPNAFEYTILSSVTLACMVEPLPTTNVTYQWNTTGCYTNINYNDGVPSCFPHDQTMQNVTDNDLTAEDAGTINCITTFDGVSYTSDSLTVLVSGIEVD